MQDRARQAAVGTPMASGRSCAHSVRGTEGVATRPASTVHSSGSSAVQGLRESTVLGRHGRCGAGTKRLLRAHVTGRCVPSRYRTPEEAV